LKEQTSLDAKLTELESEDDDRRVQEAKEELSSRLAEVHARLADMEAESGPSRAAALLAGMLGTIVNPKRLIIISGLGFDEADQQRPTKSFSGGWRYL
jgi:ATP-binding cassette subfamily F protein 3